MSDCSFCAMIKRGQEATIEKRASLMPGCLVKGEVHLDEATYRRVLIGTVLLYRHHTGPFLEGMCLACRPVWNRVEAEWLRGERAGKLPC